MKGGRPKNHIKACYITYYNDDCIEVYHLDGKGRITLENGKIIPEIHIVHNPNSPTDASDEWLQELKKATKKYLNTTGEKASRVTPVK